MNDEEKRNQEAKGEILGYICEVGIEIAESVVEIGAGAARATGSVIGGAIDVAGGAVEAVGGAAGDALSGCAGCAPMVALALITPAVLIAGHFLF